MNDEIMELNKNAIRTFLNTSKVKLWLKPYSNEDGSRDESAELLASDMANKLKIAKPIVEEILEELRVHSCVKFKAITKFKENGVATLSLKVVSSSQARDNIVPRNDNEWVEMKLNSDGSSLKKEISNKLGLEPHNLKLISYGRNIEDDYTLEQQNIQNLSSILVLCLNNEERVNFQESEHESLIGRAKKAAKLMTNRDFFNLELTDQNGKSINIPVEEKKALSVAMMLHEKGRTSMKKKNFGLALVYLLEADQEFMQCTSEILDVVDNFALLSLDVVWCYFSLQQVDSLPDAERRLAMCEEKLRRSYGSNLERVSKLRGSSCKELAIMVRLHLMQAAVYFYKGMHKQSYDMLVKTEKELKMIQVDEHAMLSVMEMGFSEIKARLALRFCNGNIGKAIEHIMAEKQEKKRIQKEEEEKKKSKTSKTLNGQLIDTQLLQYLVSMGFDENVSTNALRFQNNDLTKAIEVLQTQPSLYIAPTSLQRELNNEETEQLEALGLSREFVMDALGQSNSLQEVLAILKDKNGDMNSTTEQAIICILQDSWNDGGGAESSPHMQEEEEELVRDEMLNGITWSGDDYLNLTLEEELNILQDFKVKLRSLGHQSI